MNKTYYDQNLLEQPVEVLIVEDSETQARHLENILSTHGYRTRIAANGALGLKEARARPPTLILSDISMPEMDGFSLCQELKKDPALCNVPVILLTSLTSLYDVLKALECGADNFIRKPVEQKYLLTRIRHILVNRATRDEERVQLGMKINLGGQTHFITAERQQIFDLLISTYEEAIQMTAELRSQQEKIERSYESLEGLYQMANALNPAVTERSVLESALGRAMDLPDVEGGMIMLLNEQGALAPVVSEHCFAEEEVCTACNDCGCARKLAEGSLTEAALLDDSVFCHSSSLAENSEGKHVAVPLIVGGRNFGLMSLRLNPEADVPAETLQLFDAVGKQVAIALERAGLYTNMEALVRERTDALEIERNMLSAVVSTAGALVMLVSSDGRIVMFNPACEKALGWTKDEAIGKCYWEVLVPAEQDKSCKGFFESALQPDMTAQMSGEYLAHDGSKRYIIWTVSYVQRPDKSIEYILGSGIDVTQLRLAEEKLQFLKNFDAITGLPNRMYLMARLRVMQERNAADEQLIGFLTVSSSRLGAVRETLGESGDVELVTEIATRLKTWVAGDDIVARLRDHTFAIVLFKSDVNEISAATREVLHLLDEPFIVEGKELHLEVKGGISVFPNDGDDVDTLIGSAELAMQRALANAAEGYEFYTQSMNDEVNAEFQLENALRHALKNNELFLQYQPQLDLATGEVIGLEALLRWRHPTLGLISPVQFIALAEKTGLIRQIGDWVLRTACAQARAWQDSGLDAFRIAVNLSARQFMQPNLVQRIAAMLHEYGLPAERLDIEITESLVMHDVERAVQVLSELRRLGVQISIDDFGTGYSSLSYLKRFPIDVLKIDRSFVSGIPSEANDATIAEAIISMAHSLGVKVIAEGVENEPQCHYLSQNMCDSIQGYLFSKPLPADEVEKLLREQRRLPAHLLRMHRQPRTLLLVDDEPSILSALMRKLRGKGYRTLTASSGPSGLEILARENVDVIVSDQRMPGMTGVEFLRTVKTLYPDTVRIVLSGFTELQSVTDAVNEGAIYKFLTKPWDDEQLLSHIEEAFQHKEMVNENRRLNMEIRSANQELALANRKLEEGLAEQRRKNRISESGMDVVCAALQDAPMPVIGVDQGNVINFANAAAKELFMPNDSAEMVGASGETLIPDLLHLVRASVGADKASLDIKGRVWNVAVCHAECNGSGARTLITLMPTMSAK